MSVMVVMGLVERVPTGIDGLDALIEGGLPQGSLVLVAGCPGAGKSTLAAQYLYHGAVEHGEKGVYACFSESRRKFMNDMLRFGWDFEKLEKEGKFSFLELQTLKEAGVQPTLDVIFSKVNTFEAKRLVIDSFTVLALAMKEKIDVRTLLHLFYKLLQQSQCTTILITDSSWGQSTIGSGVEEFIADGVILLNISLTSQEAKRTLFILKMRGTKHDLQCHPMYLSERGVEVIPPAR
jgi:circadian clock protein KaiC